METHMDRWERTQLATSHAQETLNKCVVDGARILFTKLIALLQLRVCALNFMFPLLRSDVYLANTRAILWLYLSYDGTCKDLKDHARSFA